jgi:hypothetical protein
MLRGVKIKNMKKYSTLWPPGATGTPNFSSLKAGFTENIDMQAPKNGRGWRRNAKENK